MWREAKCFTSQLEMESMGFVLCGGDGLLGASYILFLLDEMT